MTLNLFKPFLAILVLAILAGAVFSLSYQPQDFAAAREQDALQGEALRHAEEVNRLGETNLSNGYINVAVRRQYWTIFLGGLALALFAMAIFTGAGYSAYAVSCTLEMSIPKLAEARKRYQEIMTRPQLDYLPDGRGVFTTRGGRVLLFDQTNQVKLLEVENLSTNPLLVEMYALDKKTAAAVAMSKARGQVEVIQ